MSIIKCEATSKHEWELVQSKERRRYINKTRISQRRMLIQTHLVKNDETLRSLFHSKNTTTNSTKIIDARKISQLIYRALWRKATSTEISIWYKDWKLRSKIKRRWTYFVLVVKICDLYIFLRTQLSLFNSISVIIKDYLNINTRSILYS